MKIQCTCIQLVAKVALSSRHQCIKEHEIHMQLTNYSEAIKLQKIKVIKMQQQRQHRQARPYSLCILYKTASTLI